MKTKEQIIRYLSRRSYPEQDWLEILDYCRQVYGSGVHKSIRPVSESTKTEFMDWIDHGIGDGDVVRYGQTYGIFVDNADGTAKLVSYYDKDNNIIIGELLINPEKASASSIQNEYSQDLAQAGYEYSVSLAKLIPRKLPPLNERLRFVSKSEIGIGIVSKIEDGMVYFACCIVGGQLFTDKKYDLRGFHFSKIDKSGIEAFQNALRQNGLQWNHHSHAITKALERSEKGKAYWYITDKFGIAREIDRYTKTSDIRYDNHNYFTSYADAAAFREFIYQYRESQIKRPE